MFIIREHVKCFIFIYNISYTIFKHTINCNDRFSSTVDVIVCMLSCVNCFHIINYVDTKCMSTAMLHHN